MRARMLGLCFFWGLLFVGCGEIVVNQEPGCEECPERCIRAESGRGRCVECISDDQCRSSASPARKCQQNKCTCGGDEDCAKGQRCSVNGCVECLEDSHCTSKDRPVCGVGNSCSACKPKEEQACAPEGATFCKKGLRVCRANGSWDSCLGVLVCKAGEICENEACVPKPPTCDTPCPEGASRCADQSSLQTCRKDERGCLVWSKATKCPTSLCSSDLDQCVRCRPKETRECYTGASNTKGVGVCRAGTETCQDDGQSWGACTGESLPKAEICDSKDNNCDGKVDEGCSCQPNATQACGNPAVGECQQGKQVCAKDGQWGSCQGEVGPKVEVCDGKDNDCDGKADEALTKPCYPGPSGTLNKGLCKGGVQACEGGKWGACRGHILPKAEVCDKLDNDCDGAVDEGCAWASKAGGSAEDVAFDIALDPQGNGYVTGYFTGKATFGAHTITAGAARDLFVAKIDPQGRWVWATKAGATEAIGKGIAVDAKGDAVVVGYFRGSCRINSSSLSSRGGWDVLIAKVDSKGKWLWGKRAGGRGNDGAFAVGLDSKGNSFTIGYLQGTTDFGPTKLSSKGNNDIFVTGLSSTGAWLWSQRAGGTKKEHGHGIAVRGGGVYITGYFEGSAGFGNKTLTSAGSADFFVARLAAVDGKWGWSTKAGGAGYDKGIGIAVNAKAEAFVSGTFSQSANFGTVKRKAKGKNDLVVAKLDNKGNWLWVTTAGSTEADESFGLALDSNDHTYITGKINGPTTFGTSSVGVRGGLSAFVASVDASGAWRWVEAAGAISTGDGLALDPQNKLVTAGFFQGTVRFDNQTLVSSGKAFDIFVWKR